jgi:fumarylacetoacetase
MSMIDETHDPSRTSWVDGADDHSDFPIQNLPLGIFSPKGEPARAGCAIGDHILDLHAAANAGLLPDLAAATLKGETLNDLLGLVPVARRELRLHLSALLGEQTHAETVRPMLHKAEDCALHLPARIGDYTDFFVGINHALNVGRQFRPDDPLLPNYKWVPIGYHGRASSVRPSGETVTRPNGQRKGPEDEAPSFGPSRRLDYELELGVWMGQGNALGKPVPIDQAEDHIAGFCLLNDWSARDLQTWEYQPLGPFLAKNFLTTVSPWIVTAEAMAPFRMPQPPRPAGDPKPLPYLWSDKDQATGALALELEVSILTPTMREAGLAPHRLSRGPASNMYWTVAQILTHHASGGCNLNPGDLLGTGTISTPDDSGLGSLLEISRGGAQPVALPSGETRGFLEDGDEILFAAHAKAEGRRAIGFGPCRGIVAPAP